MAGVKKPIIQMNWSKGGICFKKYHAIEDY